MVGATRCPIVVHVAPRCGSRALQGLQGGLRARCGVRAVLSCRSGTAMVQRWHSNGTAMAHGTRYRCRSILCHLQSIMVVRVLGSQGGCSHVRYADQRRDGRGHKRHMCVHRGRQVGTGTLLNTAKEEGNHGCESSAYQMINGIIGRPCKGNAMYIRRHLGGMHSLAHVGANIVCVNNTWCVVCSH